MTAREKALAEREALDRACEEIAEVARAREELTPEQWARDIIERATDRADAQSLSAGEVVELANLLAELREYRRTAGPLPRGRW